MTRTERDLSPLRCTTWLAPSLPAALFEELAAIAGAAVGRPAILAFETATSGPARGTPFPADTDLGFLCTPTFLWQRDLDPCAIELVGAAPVWDDDRNGGRPTYFADLVVAAASPARTVGDLADATWACNDACSLSGCLSVVDALAGSDGRPTFVSSGSHLRSLDFVRSGRADAAAIDSNVLVRLSGSAPHLIAGLHLVGSVGPYPVQPIVATVASGIAGAIAASLLSLPAGSLAAHGIIGFAPVTVDDYEAYRPHLERLALLAPPF